MQRIVLEVCLQPPLAAPGPATDLLAALQAGAQPLAASAEAHLQAVFVQAGRTRALGGLPGSLHLEAGALQDAVGRGLFEQRPVFLDHAAGRHPSLRDLAGETLASAWDYELEAVRGALRLYPTHAGLVAAEVLRAAACTLRPSQDIGLSLVFFTNRVETDAQGVRHVQAIDYVESVDLVFQPAAGGRILECPAGFFQSNSILHKEEPMTNSEQTRPSTAWAGESAALPAAESHGLPNAAANPAACAAAGASPDEPPARRSALALHAAHDMMLSLSGLPEASRERLRQSGEEASLSEMQQAIEAEREYLGKLAAANVVKIGGEAPRGGGIQVGRSGVEQLQAALDALLVGGRPPAGVAPLSGIREAYLHLSGDYEMTGVFHPERIALAAVDSSSMAGMVANALNKAVVNAFQVYPRWWEPFTMIEDFATLQQVKWITLGGVGELPTVAEGAAYSELTWDDQTETADFVKKGGYLGLTIEAIDKDDTRRLQSAPRALAQAAWLTLSKSISSIFTANSGVGPTLSDALALFHTTHGNLGTTALSITSYAAARTAMRKQAELNSGERLGALTAPKFLLVPPDLEITALQVIASENDYTYALSNGTAAPANAFANGENFQARMEFARRRVVVVDLWTDTNNWAAVADPMLYPTIGLGYRYGRTPEVFSVASPTAGLMFSNDVMPVKVRYFYAVGPVDYRGLYKANVA